MNRDLAHPFEWIYNLQSFIAVARARSFTAAARELGVSRSAVSQSVRQLEAELRVTLVARTTRSVSVTDAKLLRSKETVAVQRHEETVAYIVPRERMDALLEALAVLANQEARRAIRRDQAGKSKYLPVSALDENVG